MTQLFDAVLIADWSARAALSPRRPSPDAIWFAVARGGRAGAPVYCRGRTEAVARIADLLAAELAAGRRVLAGFDFPFGWPRGLAAGLTGRAEGLALWDWLSERVADAPDNRSNRFAVAEEINARFDGVGPFWGRPRGARHPGVPERGRDRHGTDHPPERRHVEARVPGAQPCWKLYTTGSVGSQALLGTPALNRLRRDPRLAGRARVWPFETGFASPAAAVTLAEVYPSLLAARVRAERRAGEILDSAQVRVLAEAFSALDAAGGLAPAFAAAADLPAAARAEAAREEAWILGVETRTALEAAR